MRKTYYSPKKGIAKSRKPFFLKSSSGIQTKKNKNHFFQTSLESLSMGQPGDKYEVEADAMADKVFQRLERKKVAVLLFLKLRGECGFTSQM